MKYTFTLFFCLWFSIINSQNVETSIWHNTSTLDQYGDKTGDAYVYMSQGTFSNSATENELFIGKFQYVPGNYYGLACYFYGSNPVEFGRSASVNLYFKKDGKEKSKRFKVNKNLLYISHKDITELPLPCKLLFKQSDESAFTFLVEAPALPVK